MDLNTFENTLGDLKDRLSLSGMGKPAFVGVVAVLLAVAVLVGWRLVDSAAANNFEVARSSSAEESQSTSVETMPATLFVHVSGAVVNPGLYEVAGGSRVADAVNAAGGFAEGAATGSVNLARTISDGEQIIVAEESGQGQAGQAASPGVASSGTSAVGAVTGLVNINTASAAELVVLPGIGEATASRIVADRDANGPFKNIEDLKRVSGIGDKKFEALSGLICI